METFGLKELTHSEMEQIEGGFFALILVAAEAYLAVCGVAYVAGYTVGRLEKALN